MSKSEYQKDFMMGVIAAAVGGFVVVLWLMRDLLFHPIADDVMFWTALVLSWGAPWLSASGIYLLRGIIKYRRKDSTS